MSHTSNGLVASHHVLLDESAGDIVEHSVVGRPDDGRHELGCTSCS